MPFNKRITPGSPAVLLIMQGILFVVILMVILRRPKGGGRQDLRGNRLVEPSAFRQGAFRCFCCRSLCFVVPENRRLVRSTAIVKLPPRIGRVYLPPKYIQQSVIGENTRIKRNLNSLIVPCRLGTDFFVRRIVLVSPRVPGNHANNAGPLFKRFDHTPETPSRECGQLVFLVLIVNHVHHSIPLSHTINVPFSPALVPCIKPLESTDITCQTDE